MGDSVVHMADGITPVGFPERIQAARKAAGLTVEQLAESSGIALRTLRRRLEQRPELFTLQEIDAVAEATGTTVEQLVTGQVEVIR